ncbi:common central domain of tyrosinase [Ancylostoma caninum]|uniref:Common central domain of tyrosinase n=1 Tax=Ancylostoma caninum TaxID=29170 RepID=A0A368GGR1_ANCCA|nr:common central domain of tyrosinase [Ancylostoma caninum]
MSRAKYLLLWTTAFGWITVITCIDCSKAPSEALRIVCQQLQRWDDGARKTPAPTSVKPPSIGGKVQLAADFAPIASNMYQCMDIACLCVFFRGSGGASCMVQGRPLRKALRKEYRQLTDDERNRVHTAFRTIKSSGEFDRLARIHAQFASSGGAHSGPAFLPWHREYMKRVEIALRQVDPEIALPYWDSTLDENMPNSKDSIMWTNEFMGETTGGSVSGGPFREWRTLEGRPNIRRDVGAKGKCFSEDEIQFMMGQTDISQVLAFTSPKQGCPFQPNFNVIEYTHGNPHIYVGGEMFDQATAGNDPVFYMHHSFVDYIWEMWRQSKQVTIIYVLLHSFEDFLVIVKDQHFHLAIPFFTKKRV